MPLTPEDVSNKRFTAVRLREGYDMGEVDQFLDEIESELSRLTRENDELRTKLTAVQHAGPAPETSQPSAAFAAAPVAEGTSGGGEAEHAEHDAAAPEEAHEEAHEEPAEPAAAAEADSGHNSAEDAAEPAEESAPDEAAAEHEEPAAEDDAADAQTFTQSDAGQTEQAPQTIHVTTAAEAGSAASRLLELATQSADQLVAEAKAKAEQLIKDAKAQASKLEADTKTRNDQLESEARGRAQMLDGETQQRRTELLSGLESEHNELGGRVESLRAFEREYRGRLRTYFSQQLDALGSDDAQGGSESGGAAPKRLRSVLDDNQGYEQH